MVLKLPGARKWMFWAFKEGIFQFFANIWVTKMKLFSGKVRQSVEGYLNQNLVIGSFLENSFEDTVSSKAKVLSDWKGHFSGFSQSFEWQSWKCFLGKWGKAFKTRRDRLLQKMRSYGPILLSQFRLSFCENIWMRRRLATTFLFLFS